jgi:hypothetical protein
MTDTGTHDLEDLNPAPPSNPTIRVVVPEGVRIRKEPTTASEQLGSYGAGTQVTMQGYVRGQSVEGSDIWFKVVETNNYCHSSGFTDGSTNGLPDLTPVTPPPEPPPVEPEPYEPKDPEIVNITAEDIPSWITYETAVDTDDTDKTNEEAYIYYKEKYNQDYKYYPIELHAHWWGAPDAGYTHNGVVEHMKNTKDLSVDFVVSAKRITNFESLGIVSYTTGARSMYGWTAEIDPVLSEDVYKTVGCLVYIVEKKNPRLAGEAIRLHKEFMATSCSEINVNKVREYANKFSSGELDFETGEPPEQPPEPPTSGALSKEEFDRYVRLQKEAMEAYLDGADDTSNLTVNKGE